MILQEAQAAENWLKGVKTWQPRGKERY